MFAWLRGTYHTRKSFQGLVGTAVAGGGLGVAGAGLVLVALPLAALGAWSLLAAGAP